MTVLASDARIEAHRSQELLDHQLLLRHHMRSLRVLPGEGGDGLVDMHHFHEHFCGTIALEESLMVETGYPDQDDHRGQHRELIRQLGDLLRAETTTDHAVVKIGAFLVRLRTHLCRSDGLFAQFLIEQERRIML